MDRRREVAKPRHFFPRTFVVWVSIVGASILASSTATAAAAANGPASSDGRHPSLRRAAVDEHGCNSTAGETWCDSLEVCHKQWATACPSSATCTVAGDCRMRLGGCGPYVCQCLPYGIDELDPTECAPLDLVQMGLEPPCACAGCLPGTCSDVEAGCVEGVCAVVAKATTGDTGDNNVPTPQTGVDPTAVNSTTSYPVCGGIAGIPCEEGLLCYTGISDDCDPDCGGVDCQGQCREVVERAQCGGFAGFVCPAGSECFDEKGDLCSPNCGGADCMGICLVVPKETAPPVVVEPDAAECPAEEPSPGSSCSAATDGVGGVLSCTYGEECCCGACSHSFQCDCLDGQWMCLYSDFCLAAVPCESDGECGDTQGCSSGTCCEKDDELSPAGTTECPVEEPVPNSACSSSTDGSVLSCSYGEECCCGACSHSFQCDCLDGQWACLNTDFCFGAAPCESDEECGDTKECSLGTCCEKADDNNGTAECPVEEPVPNSACSPATDRSVLSCTYGEECCCGACSHSFQCDCLDGQWICLYTDFCFGAAPCESDGECGDTQECSLGTCCEKADDGSTSTDQFGCDTNAGEEWCESLRRCNKPWEAICPTSASCSSHDDCRMDLGTCGPYMCQCIVTGVNETYPLECSPSGAPGCSCARCTADSCSGHVAACIGGVCGLAEIDEESGEFVCNTEMGERWCESLQVCHQPWITNCPTSATCISDDDCRMRLGDCGPYACQCVVAGINEPWPLDCPPEFTGEPCACADCMGGACSDQEAACIEGVCGFRTIPDDGDEDGCIMSQGETWCGSLQECIKPWETVCPTSAPCSSDGDCEMKIGGCGPYACQCIVKGIDETYPEECPPDFVNEPCACAGCIPGTCSDEAAACVNGVCGLASALVSGTQSPQVPPLEEVIPEGGDSNSSEYLTPDVGDERESDMEGCNTAAGETWCESLRQCTKPWESVCETSATCSSDDDCTMRIGGCGPYACLCLAYGVNETTPSECPPDFVGEPCACADCLPEACSDKEAACLDGICSLRSTDNMTQPLAEDPDETDSNGCNTTAGEMWCESLDTCHKPWEVICPSSAYCTSKDDCQMQIGGCGIYACKCIVFGINETYPEECDPAPVPTLCACSGCEPGICSNDEAACIEGVCSLVEVASPTLSSTTVAKLSRCTPLVMLSGSFIGALIL